MKPKRLFCVSLVGLLVQACGTAAQPPTRFPPTHRRLAPANLSFMPECAPGQNGAPNLCRTTRSGLITEDEVWSGIVYITGDIVVEAGVTLALLPGTVVFFAAHQDDQGTGVPVPVDPLDADDWIIRNGDPTWTLEYARSHSTLDVYGKLIAKGTPENWITFTSSSLTPDGGDWMQLHINAGSVLEYCIVEYSRGGIDIAEGTANTVTVSHSLMRHNLWTGLAIHSSSPTITHNEITESGGHQGIDVLGEGSAPLLSFNVIRHNKVGIAVQPGTSPIIEYNSLVDNDMGIRVMESGSAVIQGNLISAPHGAPNDWSYQGRAIYPASALAGNENEVTGITVLNASPRVLGNTVSRCPNGMVFLGYSSPEIRGNTFEGSVDNGLFFDRSFAGHPSIHANNIQAPSCSLCSESLHPIDVSRNWWGTADPVQIAHAVRSRGPIRFEPYLTQQVEME